ncbi:MULTISPECIES: hypothetical protein [unclassified Azospirillum]|uniref:hypothetical protein n=1 Tax=unclassified Azospirillum TaxID=2630922 RepID=UPI000B6BD967|nr:MULTISPECIES: hypothetical protein [unclassified Azospirillum]SNR94831.1 hypothetical protein SAMN05880556_101721 [Azospirillum sp. RU38E]SNS11019.1 hypothetical protein SAMN05880591_101721 [Azospirillum sp. RU37A]
MPQNTEQERLDRCFSRVERDLPGWVARPLAWLRRPGGRWLRIPMALLLIAGGCLWFLPVLGLWMLPLGIALLAFEIPPLQRPVSRLIIWGERKWRRRQRRRRG